MFFSNLLFDFSTYCLHGRRSERIPSEEPQVSKQYIVLIYTLFYNSVSKLENNVIYRIIHFRHFTRHQYFDSNGMFISIVMSTPLLLASGFIAVSIIMTQMSLEK